MMTNQNQNFTPSINTINISNPSAYTNQNQVPFGISPRTATQNSYRAPFSTEQTPNTHTPNTAQQLLPFATQYNIPSQTAVPSAQNMSRPNFQPTPPALHLSRNSISNKPLDFTTKKPRNAREEKIQKYFPNLTEFDWTEFSERRKQIHAANIFPFTAKPTIQTMF